MPSHMHDEEELYAPEQTVPQGTQEHGVEHGHEDLDLNFRSTINWFASLAVLVAVVLVLLEGASWLWYRHQADVERAEIPALYHTPQAPPQPRLYPNPVDQKKDAGAVLLWQVRLREQGAENQRLAQINLWNPALNQAEIPHDAVARFQQANARGGGTAAGIKTGQVTETASGPLGVVEPMPSYASGGTRTDNRLQ